MTIEVSQDNASLMRTAAEQLVRLAASAISARGRFAVALSGGSTPRALYQLLAGSAFAKRVDWPRVHVFWSDERCVPPDNPESNYRMAREAVLNAVPLPADNIHRIQGELEPEQAAAAYEQTLRSFFGYSSKATPQVPIFDLILLGMGDNGHTASLFPGTWSVRERVRWVVAQYVEVVKMWRITFTPVLINAAANVTFLVSGAAKADMLKRVLEGPYQPDVLPSQIVKPTNGQLCWLVDKAAAARLKSTNQG